MNDRDEKHSESEFQIPEGMTIYYMGLLYRGPNSTDEVTPELEALQRRHLAYIRKIHEAGQMALAGPFVDGGDLRGIFLFRTGSLEEALALAAGDPSVQAGRLIVDIHPWMGPENLTAD